MAVGDKQAQSYGWQATLGAPVEDGGEVIIPAPGFDHRYTDTRYTDVRVGSLRQVYRVGDEESGATVGAVFNKAGHDDPVTITLTNHTATTWPTGDEIYVFCPHLLSTAHNEYDLKEQLWDLQQRVSALEEAGAGGAKAHAKADAEPQAKAHHPKAAPDHNKRK
jgi:hypothetical protein